MPLTDAKDVFVWLFYCRRMHSVLSVVLFVSYAFCVSVAVLLQAKRAACAFLQGLEALLFGTEAIAFLFYGIKASTPCAALISVQRAE